ncbi:MAG: sugar phosphate nucleotidyltransferase [Eubacteriales bacterium]|nr:sugar phosphate nucleotidyltransferase [Eubacteriales bacterium]
MKTQLLIMAAGIGSRFGQGIKQLTKVGPNGQIIMDYSINDAKKAGFDEVVFVLRKEIEEEFIEVIGKRIEKLIPCKYVFQELDKLPSGYILPQDRKKPWGTAHCIICAKEAIDSPFLVINADDYYGKSGFNKIHEYLVSTKIPNEKKVELCMAGFIVKNTLSDNGTVTRGVCKVNNDNILNSVTETYDIAYDENNNLFGLDEEKNKVKVDENAIVSMNMWGLPKEFVNMLDKDFEDFLNVNLNNPKAEFLLPSIIDTKIQKEECIVKVLKVDDKWFGVTYAEDKFKVQKEFKKLHEMGEY